MVVKTDVTKIRMSDWYSIVVEYIYKLFKVVTEVGLEGVKLLENLVIKTSQRQKYKTLWVLLNKQYFCFSRESFKIIAFISLHTKLISTVYQLAEEGGGYKNLLGSLLFLIVITHSTVPQGKAGGSTYHPTRSSLSAVSYCYTFTSSSSFHNLKRKI